MGDPVSTLGLTGQQVPWELGTQEEAGVRDPVRSGPGESRQAQALELFAVVQKRPLAPQQQHF